MKLKKKVAPTFFLASFLSLKRDPSFVARDHSTFHADVHHDTADRAVDQRSRKATGRTSPPPTSTGRPLREGRPAPPWRMTGPRFPSDGGCGPPRGRRGARAAARAGRGARPARAVRSAPYPSSVQLPVRVVPSRLRSRGGG